MAPSAVLLDGRVTPRGGQNAANKAVVRLLASALGLRPRQIEAVLPVVSSLP